MSSSFLSRRLAFVCGALMLLCMFASSLAHAQSAAQSRNRAPGFTSLPAGANILVMTPDVELFSMSAGGLMEPKADWTDAAQRHLREALRKKIDELRLTPRFISDQDNDAFADVSSLHAAVASAIDFHHFGAGFQKLPTKNGVLDWSLGEAVFPIRDKTGADYALFIWVRDSYASAERKAAMLLMAAFGVGIQMGAQIGYASLVDLRTGQVMWFNRLISATGDLREAGPAAASLNSLLTDFPVMK